MRDALRKNNIHRFYRGISYATSCHISMHSRRYKKTYEVGGQFESPIARIYL